MEERLPLVYFFGLVPGKYVAAWPVYVVGDVPADLRFSIAVDDALHVGLLGGGVGVVREEGEEARRRYITAVVRRRLHQRAFRERVLTAYRHACAFCRFRHEELLDAAHIIGDTEAAGQPVVRNGISLCRLHHAAFDRHFLGVNPDFRIEVRRDLLEEENGPDAAARNPGAAWSADVPAPSCCGSSGRRAHSRAVPALPRGGGPSVVTAMNETALDNARPAVAGAGLSSHRRRWSAGPGELGAPRA